MVMSVKSSNSNKRIFKQIDRMGDIIEQTISETWEDFADILKREAVRSVKKPKRGRVYTIRSRTGNRRRHRASAPGESHADVTGTLTKSLDHKNKGDILEFGYLNNPPKYARTVEKTRPTLSNTAKKNQGEVNKIFSVFIRKEFK